MLGLRSDYYLDVGRDTGESAFFVVIDKYVSFSRSVTLDICETDRVAQASPSQQQLCKSPACVPLGKAMAEDLTPSLVIKGCWQLSGGHKGDGSTDRTYV